MRCKTCKHWMPSGSIGGPIEQWKCHTDSQDVGLCLKASNPGEGSAPKMAAVCEGEAIYGSLITDAEFGCVLHDPS